MPGADAGGAAAGDPGVAEVAEGHGHGGSSPGPSHSTDFPGRVWGVLQKGHMVTVSIFYFLGPNYHGFEVRAAGF